MGYGRTRDIGLNDASRALHARFGKRANLIYDGPRKKYFAGRFLRDADEWQRDERGDVQLDETGKPRPALPWRRDQEFYGCGATLEEALRFLTGGRPTLVGYRPRFDEYGNVRALRSPAGLIVSDMPAAPPAAAGAPSES